jgi:hypothetical protein
MPIGRTSNTIIFKYIGYIFLLFTSGYPRPQTVNQPHPVSHKAGIKQWCPAHLQNEVGQVRIDLSHSIIHFGVG